MDCKYLDESYELFLLAAAPPDVAATIREHVGRDCEYCLAHLRQAAQAVYFLCQPVRPIRPNPKVKTELFHQIHRK